MTETEVVSFPGHEKAIEIMAEAQKKLEALGYSVEFSKTFTVEELLPLYSKAHFRMHLSARRGPYCEQR